MIDLSALRHYATMTAVQFYDTTVVRRALRELLAQLVKTPGDDWVFEGKPPIFDQARTLNGLLYETETDLAAVTSLLQDIGKGKIDVHTALIALVNGEDVAPSLVRAVVSGLYERATQIEALAAKMRDHSL